MGMSVFFSGQGAADNCTEAESGFAFFDNKKNSWDESETIRILKCEKEYRLELLETKSKRKLDSVSISAPTTGETWYLDGISCNIKGVSDRFIANKAIVGIDLKVREGWAVVRKTKKWKKLEASLVTCYKDEP